MIFFLLVDIGCVRILQGCHFVCADDGHLTANVVQNRDVFFLTCDALCCSSYADLLLFDGVVLLSKHLHCLWDDEESVKYNVICL